MWSPEGRLLASGGNDNTVHLWETGRDRPLHTITEHQSAVKAVSWCPWQPGVLATAGGTVDRTIRLASQGSGVVAREGWGWLGDRSSLTNVQNFPLIF